VREAEWLDGWQYAMIYSDSGRIEEGAVFSTPHDGEEDTMNYFLETGTKLIRA
jgi:hypothetical protein